MGWQGGLSDQDPAMTFDADSPKRLAGACAAGTAGYLLAHLFLIFPTLETVTLLAMGAFGSLWGLVVAQQILRRRPAAALIVGFVCVAMWTLPLRPAVARYWEITLHGPISCRC